MRRNVDGCANNRDKKSECVMADGPSIRDSSNSSQRTKTQKKTQEEEDENLCGIFCHLPLQPTRQTTDGAATQIWTNFLQFFAIFAELFRNLSKNISQFYFFRYFLAILQIFSRYFYMNLFQNSVGIASTLANFLTKPPKKKHSPR